MIEKIHLQIIHALHTEGSLTKAAEKLHLTQSALSHAIKKLEQQLNHSLWQQKGKQLHLTQEGQYLLQMAQKVLPYFWEAQQHLMDYAKGKRGMLRFGIDCYPCYTWLLQILQNFWQAWPKIEVDIKQKFQFDGVEALQNYDIDVLVTPDPVYQKEMVFTPVFAYEQVLIVNKDHRLAKQKNVYPIDLSTEILLSYPVEKTRLDIYTQFLNPAQITPIQHRSIENTDILLHMVAQGHGVAAVPLWLANQYAQNLAIESIRLGSKGIHKHIYLGRRLNDEKKYLIELIEMAKMLNSH